MKCTEIDLPPKYHPRTGRERVIRVDAERGDHLRDGHASATILIRPARQPPATNDEFEYRIFKPTDPPDLSDAAATGPFDGDSRGDIQAIAERVLHDAHWATHTDVTFTETVVQQLPPTRTR